MPLAHLVGITNTNQTFSAGFSFIRTESCEDFNFIHQQMADIVWGECCPFPQVVITDQSSRGGVEVEEETQEVIAIESVCTLHCSINNKTTCSEPEKPKLPVPSQSGVSK